MNRLIIAFSTTGRLYSRLERSVSVLLVLSLCAFAVLQILLRNFFSTGLIWADSLIRHAVLWVAFIGAARAVTEDRHIRIDLIPMALPAGAARVVRFASGAIPVLVCSVLTWASILFVLRERSDGLVAFAKIRFWWLELIFPLSFAVMTLRYGRRLFAGEYHRTAKGAE